MKIQIKRTLILFFIAIAAAVMVIMTTAWNDHGAQAAAESTPAAVGKIKQIIAGKANDTFILFDNNKLFATGDDNYGQHGKEKKNATNKFTSSKLPDGEVTSVVCGSNNTMAVVDGKLYAVGDNSFGVLGRGNTHNNTQTAAFEEVSSFEASNIISTSIGNTHAMVIAEKASGGGTLLYGAGSNSNGELGIEKISAKQESYVAALYLMGIRFDSVVCGQNYSMALTNEGALYSAGHNDHILPGNDNNKFTEISLPKGVQGNSIVGGLYNAALIGSGKLYMIGKNDYGQLGLGNNSAHTDGFVQVLSNVEKISSVAFGENHTAVLTSDGKMFVAGNNADGQLGLGAFDDADKFGTNDGSRYAKEFIEVTALESSPLYQKKIRSVVCGKNHTVALTSDGELYAAGNNSSGQLGLGNTDNQNIFTKVSLDYTVNFDAHGGSTPDGASVTQTIPYHKATPLQENPFTKEGYTIAGWATTEDNADKGIVEYKDKAEVVYLADIDKSITLYAVWKPAVPDVTIAAEKTTITYGNGSITLTANHKEYTGQTYTYLWYKNNAALTVAESAAGKTLTLKNADQSGAYKVQVTATFEGSESDAAISDEIRITINKAELSSLKVSIDNWVYGEIAKVPEVTGNPGGGEVTYHYRGTTNGEIGYDSTTPPTDAGNYTVTATIPETANYLGTSVEQNFEIVRAEQDLSISVNGWIYGELPHDPVVSGNDGECEYLYTGTANDGTEHSSSEVPVKAGTYTVTVTAAETNNYNKATAESSAFEIERATLTPKLTLDNWTYGGTPSIPVLAGNDGNGTVSSKYTALDLDGAKFTESYEGLAALDAACRAGSGYTLEVVIAKTGNYESVTVRVHFDIHRKTIGAPEIQATVFDGHEQTAEISDTNDYYVTKNNGGTEIGEYDVVLTLKDVVNTQWEDGKGTIGGVNNEDLTLTFRIIGNVNSWTIKPSVTDVEYGKEIEVKYEAKIGNEQVEVTYYDKDGNKLNDAPTAVGHYKAIFRINETMEYTGLEADTEFDILPKKVTVTIENKRQVYNGEELELTWSTPDGSIVSGDKLNVELAREPGKDAGTYKINGKWDNGNYNVTFEGGVYTIAKAKYDVSGVEFAGKEVTYDGSAHSLEVTGLPAGVSVEYMGNDKKNAGEYEVTAKFTVDANHEAIPDMTATLKINKAKYALPMFEDVTVTYDGESHSLKVTGVPYGVTVEYEGNGKTEAGTYTVTAKFTCDANYEAIGDLTATLTILEKGGCGSVVLDGVTIAGIAISVLAFAAFLAVRKAKSKKK